MFRMIAPVPASASQMPSVSPSCGTGASHSTSRDTYSRPPVGQHLHLMVHWPERRTLVGQSVQLAAERVDLDQSCRGGSA